jgi:hypothetical protein
VFGLLDLVKFEKMGLVLVKNVNILKSAKKRPIHSLLTPGYQQRTCPKILKICQETKFDMGFLKKKQEKPKFEHRFF